ncbi:hypothetical protein H6P81_005718 [Aristolochia fimbriata]|uniref:U3 snoRNP-associated protein-like EMB2271 n=1 Tax=Aristolochia fimbriata TaxID=158543 RepID=A0AAV7EWN0_ARIFI|nr:hypothetical protein H6P81_005718 [Aristolochia fimbriata]
MKKSRAGKKRSLSGGGGKNRRTSTGVDPFFSSGTKKQRKLHDDIVDSSDSDDEAGEPPVHEGGEEESELAAETADEKRLRLAKEYVESFRALKKRREEEDEDEEEDGEGPDGYEDGRGPKGDLLVAEKLLQEQLEQSGRVRRVIASRVEKPDSDDGFRLIRRHRQSVTAVALSEDDAKGFSASKDGTIFHWDLSSGQSEKYLFPTKEVLISHGAKTPQNPSTSWSKHVLSLAVSSDGRYLATAGLDRHVHLWDTRTREHIRALPGHKGPISCLAFRHGTSELASGSFDRSINLWNADDRAYMETLLGHASEVLAIDCLRKERLLTVGRDRAMMLWKVPEQSHLIFRASASSLECCCFINNEEFLSGSDDGSIELWNFMRKKPVCIVKNAHSIPSSDDRVDSKENGIVCNGDKTANGNCTWSTCSKAQSWVGAVAVCRGSDLAASGAANGVVRLWSIESATKSIRPLYSLPLGGFVNSLAFAKSGHFLIAGVGQEPRLGRWGRVSDAQNGVFIQSLKLSEE